MLNNSVKNEVILIIFGVQNSAEISLKKILHSPTCLNIVSTLSCEYIYIHTPTHTKSENLYFHQITSWKVSDTHTAKLRRMWVRLPKLLQIPAKPS